jgi:hypothetical protein
MSGKPVGSGVWRIKFPTVYDAGLHRKFKDSLNPIYDPVANCITNIESLHEAFDSVAAHAEHCCKMVLVET